MKINKYLSKSAYPTLNIILLLIGVQFVMSFFLGPNAEISDSRNVTIPYRLVVLFICSVLIFRAKFKRNMSKIFFLWVLFLGIYFLRIVFNILLGEVYYEDQTLLFSYIFLIEIPLIYSILYSYKNINFQIIFELVLYLSIFTTIYIIYTNPSVFNVSNIITKRVSGNVAFSTISFGHFCASILLLSIHKFFILDRNVFNKSLSLIYILFAFFCLVRTGSRGPLFSIFISIFFFYILNAESIKKIILRLLISVSLVILSINVFLIGLEYLSPYFANRLSDSIKKGSLGGRSVYYDRAYEMINNHFIFGDKFMVEFGFENYDYAHNILLDILLGTGFIGLLFFLYIHFNIFKNIRYIFLNNKKISWVALIYLQYLSFLFLSGAFYMNPIFLGFSTILILLNEKYFVNNKFVS